MQIRAVQPFELAQPNAAGLGIMSAQIPDGAKAVLLEKAVPEMTQAVQCMQRPTSPR